VKNIIVLGEYNPPRGEPVKSRLIAGLLGVILGWLGVHRFYLGFYRIGFFQLLVTAITLGAGAVWGFVDGVLILSGHVDRDGQNRPLKK
jgi:TM2 domain-containing membrane protein YozV